MITRLHAVLLGALALAACGGPDDSVDAPDPALDTAEGAVVSCTFSKTEPSCQVRECFCPNGITGLPAAWATGGREGMAPAPFDRVAASTHWIGYIVQGVGVCPQPNPAARGHWQVEQPFASATAVPELHRFCEYTWIGDNGQPVADLEALPNLRGLDPIAPAGGTIMRLEPDLEAAVSLGEPVPYEAWKPLETAWFSQIDRAPWPGVGTQADRHDAPVRVAIIDAAQDGLPDVYSQPWGSRSRHADVVGSIIDHLVCPPEREGTGSAGCAAQIRNYLALNNLGADEVAPLLVRGQVFDPAEAATGGYFGRIHDTARAVGRAVEEWRRDVRCQGDPALCNPDLKLVINLSLGWSKEFTGAALNAMRAPVRAAYLATREARCAGALVIAASGNRGEKRLTDTGAVTELTGPTYPAGWEKLAPGTCVVSAAGAYTPLVHAVGGVTGRGELLGNARPASAPRLLAPGENIAVEERSSSMLGGTLPATGSSLAAAAVSALAADVWALRPEMTPDQVMEHLYQSGLATTRDAQLYRQLDASTGLKYKQHVVSQCAALVTACDVQGDAPRLCPDLAVLEAMKGTCRDTVDVDLSADMAAVQAAAYPNLPAQPASPPTVPKMTTAAANAIETSSGYTDTGAPAVIPQPGYTACPLCTVFAATGNPLLREFSGKVDLAPGVSAYATAKLVLNLKARPNVLTTCSSELSYDLKTVAELLQGLSFKTGFSLPTTGNTTEAKCSITAAALVLSAADGTPYLLKENIKVY